MTRYSARPWIVDGDQVVPLPDHCRFDTDEVWIEKVGEKVALSPVRRGWTDFFARPSRVPAGFLDDRADGAPQERAER